MVVCLPAEATTGEESHLAAGILGNSSVLTDGVMTSGEMSPEYKSRNELSAV